MVSQIFKVPFVQNDALKSACLSTGWPALPYTTLSGEVLECGGGTCSNSQRPPGGHLGPKTIRVLGATATTDTPR